MINIKRYQDIYKEDWDNLVDNSRIDSFLHKRDFMDYHSDRFIDCSFLVYKNTRLEALIPGNISLNKWYSHQGLTFGGLISSFKVSLKDVLEIFEQLNKHLISLNVNEVIYKPVPHIYHKYPSEEDLYALFRLGSERIACNLSSTIQIRNKISFSESRNCGVRKSVQKNIVITESSDYDSYWKLLEDNLERTHGKKPVHSQAEITNLKNLFPNNIKLYCAQFDNTIVGGSILFISQNVIHVQYISATEYGKSIGALDLLFYKLINEVFTDYSLFDFGYSTEQNGHLLNNGLVFQKEGFGARGTVYETYKYSL